MRLSALRGKTIRSLGGASLGKVHEIHCDRGQVIALMCGPESIIERWTSRSRGRRIPWEAVCRIDASGIVIDEKCAT